MQILQHLDAVYVAKGFLSEGLDGNTLRKHNGEQFAVMWALKVLPMLAYVAQEAKDRGWEPTGNWYTDFVEKAGEYIYLDLDTDATDDVFNHVMTSWLVDNAGEFYLDANGENLVFGSEVLREGLRLVELPQF